MEEVVTIYNQAYRSRIRLRLSSQSEEERFCLRESRQELGARDQPLCQRLTTTKSS
jgi:hypothetical protein